ncbi:hypothetical protein J1614_005327 [Plenodomus biglobosus]|nr:hypothetical protein J1614_005327 [Plenodomus biglobosus]
MRHPQRSPSSQTGPGARLVDQIVCNEEHVDAETVVFVDLILANLCVDEGIFFHESIKVVLDLEVADVFEGACARFFQRSIDILAKTVPKDNGNHFQVSYIEVGLASDELFEPVSFQVDAYRVDFTFIALIIFAVINIQDASQKPTVGKKL